MRFERKYRIENQPVSLVRQRLTENPANFTLAYPDRRVNSIYFDNAHFDALNENFAGIGQRRKYRIRWYGEDLVNIRNPILETKIKVNKLGYKEYLKLEDFKIQELSLITRDIDIIRSRNLEPNVIISYDRTYFLSQDKIVRATIDRALSYHSVAVSRLEPLPSIDPAIILEIKYDQSKESVAESYLQAIPFRLTKNSKYASAVAKLWS